MLVVLGLTGMGTAVKYLPRPVVIGFTNGIAVLIASTQIRDFFGLQVAIDAVGVRRADGAARRGTSARSRSTATAFGATALAGMIVLRRVMPRVPGAIVAMFLGTAAAMLFGAPVDTIGARFGGIPSGLPHLHVPDVQARADPDAAAPGDHGGAARRDRIAAVGGRRGSDERRPSQPEHRAGGAGHRQHRVAHVRRPSRHRRDRADRDQHPRRREDAGRRHAARGHAAGGAARRPRRWRSSSRCRCSPRSC